MAGERKQGDPDESEKKKKWSGRGSRKGPTRNWKEEKNRGLNKGLSQL